MTAQELATLAAGLSCFAALASAAAAWRVPKSVASYNETQRRESEARAKKMGVLETLIQHRATIAYPVSVAALNSIPFVFSSSPIVRDALRRFMAATKETPPDPGRIVERHIGVINAIIRDLGMDGQIAASEVDEFYYPELLGRAHTVERMEVISRSDAFQSTANNDPRET